MPACPNCGYEADPETETCPLCGSGLEGGDVVGRRPVAWEDPGRAFPGDLWDTWTECLSAPSSFFRRVPHGQPLVRPVLYYLLISVAAAFFTLLWNAVFGTARLPGTVAGARGGEVELLLFFLSPFMALLALGVNTAVTHLMVAILAPERRGLGATARVLSYAASPGPFTAIPLLGPPVAMVWGLVLQVIGLREAHRTTTFRAALVVLIPVAAAVIGFALLAVVAYSVMEAGGLPVALGT